VIAIDSLTRGFPGHPVLHELTLHVSPGERLALRGPNGCGKTTLLRTVLGTLEPEHGSVTVGPYTAGTVEARRLVGASLSQERSFYMRLRGRENLYLYARLRGLSRRAAMTRVGELAKELELVDVVERRADRCSTGQLQMLAFARALVGEPPVLLLDEPTRSLDVAARDRLWGALERRPDTAVIIASHLDEDVGRATSVRELAAREAP
jgi:ABC-type multidrug transport system ATPase subunit